MGKPMENISQAAIRNPQHWSWVANTWGAAVLQDLPARAQDQNGGRFGENPGAVPLI